MLSFPTRGTHQTTETIETHGAYLYSEVTSMRTRIRAFCAVVSMLVFVARALPALAQVDQQRAQEYFKEVQAL